jgi:hypothetical protein
MIFAVLGNGARLVGSCRMQRRKSSVITAKGHLKQFVSVKRKENTTILISHAIMTCDASTARQRR